MNLIPKFIHRRIAHRPNLLKIVDNIGWLFFDKVLRMGVGLLVGVWIARYLGPEQFGLLNFAQAFTGLFGAIAVLGLQGIVVRDIVRDPEGTKLTLGTAAVLQLIGGLVSYLLILIFIAYLRPDDTLARSIVAILGSMMLFKVSEIAVYWFESQVQSKYTVWAQNSVFLVFAAIKVLLILQQAPLIMFVWAMLGEAVIVALILVVMMGQRGPALTSLRISTARTKALLRDSSPLFLSGIAVMLYMKIDQIMLGQMIGDEAVGIYSAAVKISEVWYFIPMAIVASVFPAILEAKMRSEAQYYARLQKLYDLMVVISVSIALPMTFLAEPVVVLLFGDAYASAGTILSIHIWGAVFVSLAVASGKWIIAENRNYLLLERHLFAAVLNICLNLVLIEHYQAVGAAIATLVAWVASSYLFDLFRERTRHQFLMKTRALNVFRVINELIEKK